MIKEGAGAPRHPEEDADAAVDRFRPQELVGHPLWDDGEDALRGEGHA